MNNKWQEINTKVAALSLRERLMILIAGLVLFYYPAYSLFLSHWWLDTNKNEVQVITINKQINGTQELIETIQFELQKNPDQELQKQRMLLLQNIQAKEAKFREMAAELVSPELMADLLKRVLHSSKGLQLIELASIEPQALLTLKNKAEDKIDTAKTTLFSHGVRLQLIGGYFDIVNFLQALEQLPESFYWKTLTYQVKKYPNAEIEIEIYTLSTQEEFIGG